MVEESFITLDQDARWMWDAFEFLNNRRSTQVTMSGSILPSNIPVEAMESYANMSGVGSEFKPVFMRLIGKLDDYWMKVKIDRLTK